MAAHSKANNAQRIDYIDAWRFLAVVMVIQAHVIIFSGVQIPALEPYSLLLDRMSELGVLIFFCISGFVICSGLVKERSETGQVCLVAFYVRRACRIMPPLWLYLFTLLVLTASGVIKISWQQALTSLLFLCNMPFPQECSWYAGHTWTLAYEEQFYLFFPVIFLWLFNKTKLTRLGFGILGLVVASVLTRVYNFTLMADFMMYFGFMLTGCFAALLPLSVLARIKNLPLAIWLLLPVFLLLCLHYLPIASEKYVKTVCYPLLITLMVLGTPMQYAWVRNFFSHAITCYLGRISYSIYLWQELATSDYTPASLLRTLSFVALVFVFAGLSFHYFEKPLIKKGAAWSKRLKTEQTPPIPTPVS